MILKQLVEAVIDAQDRLKSVLTTEVFEKHRDLIIKALIGYMSEGELTEFVAQLEGIALTKEEVKERMELMMRMLPKEMHPKIMGQFSPYIYVYHKDGDGSIMYDGGRWKVEDFQAYAKVHDEEEDAIDHFISSWKSAEADRESR